MVDISAIAGTISALKGAADIAKALISLRDAQAIQTKIIELNSIIIDAQQSALTAHNERAALIEEIRGLKEEIARMEAWNVEQERYELTDVGGGSFAYAAKPSMRGREPPHYICTNCYARRKKSLLNHIDLGDMHVLSCPTCNAKLVIHGNYKPPPVR